MVDFQEEGTSYLWSKGKQFMKRGRGRGSMIQAEAIA